MTRFYFDPDSPTSSDFFTDNWSDSASEGERDIPDSLDSAESACSFSEFLEEGHCLHYRLGIFNPYLLIAGLIQGKITILHLEVTLLGIVVRNHRVFTLSHNGSLVA
jgi:hypothetical protein